MAAHCNCVAGLGETCSHVASVLLAIEAGVRQRELMTVTNRRAYWVQPTYVKDVPYTPVTDINFTGQKGFKAAHENIRAIDRPPQPPPPPPTPAADPAVAQTPVGRSTECIFGSSGRILSKICCAGGLS